MMPGNDDKLKGQTDRPLLVKNDKTEDEMRARNDDETKGKTDRPLLDKTEAEIRAGNHDETNGQTDRPPLVENNKTEAEMRAKADSIKMPIFFSPNWSDSEMKAYIEGLKIPTSKPPNPPSFGNFEGIPRCYCEAEVQRIINARPDLKIPPSFREENLPFCEKGRQRTMNIRRDYSRLMASGDDRFTTLLYPTPRSDTYTPQEPFNKKPHRRDRSENDVAIWDADTLAQFHADALQQVGFGKYHVLMIIICGLALAAQIGQIFSLFFILPSADMEFCMMPQQKELLIIISLSGAALGALICGSIAQVNGRKRTLLTCMICMTLFSVASAFMPTFGPFAMARFCAAACGGGIFPIASVYIGEMVSSDHRGRSIGVFTSIGLIGGTVAAALSMFMLPMTGEQLLLEHKDHFRSWHRYLLFMTLSSVLPIIGLCILPESPHWLLNTGREVDALDVYKLIYTNNVCDEKCVVFECNVPAPVYKKDHYPYNVLIEMGVNVYKFFQSFIILLCPSHRNVTMSLMMIWFGAMFITFGLTEYVLRFGHIEYEQDFLSDMINISSFTYENISFTANIIKQQFTDTRFFNCTFEQILLSYVQFKSCTFLDTNFHGVKTANTTFVDSFLNNVKFIDTDISPSDFTNCVRNNTEFDRMSDGCDRQFNFSLFNEVGYRAHLAWIVPTLIIVMKTSLVLNQFGRVRASTFTLITAAILCCLVGFDSFGEVIHWIVGTVQGFVISALVALTVQAIEYHAVALRCAIMGMCVCCAHIGAAVGIHVYSGLQMGDARTAAVLSVVGLSFPSVLTTFLVDRP